MTTGTDTNARAATALVSSPLALVRLLQLVSPALPVGAYAFSQGLEWAVDNGEVHDAESLSGWLGGLMHDALVHLELPLLLRMMSACAADDAPGLARLSRQGLAARETMELRREDRHRAAAMTRLLGALGIERDAAWARALAESPLAPFALACTEWRIAPAEAALGHAFSWLDNAVAAGIKLIPLGQSAGQGVLHALAAELPALVEAAGQVPDAGIGASAPAMAIASACHETQYSRLFQS